MMFKSTVRFATFALAVNLSAPVFADNIVRVSLTDIEKEKWAHVVNVLKAHKAASKTPTNKVGTVLKKAGCIPAAALATAGIVLLPEKALNYGMPRVPQYVQYLPAGWQKGAADNAPYFIIGATGLAIIASYTLLVKLCEIAGDKLEAVPVQKQKALAALVNEWRQQPEKFPAELQSLLAGLNQLACLNQQEKEELIAALMAIGTSATIVDMLLP